MRISDVGVVVWPKGVYELIGYTKGLFSFSEIKIWIVNKNQCLNLFVNQFGFYMQ